MPLTSIWNSAGHIFLLIGENTLPNYVAARLLVAQGANIYLLHSEETITYASFLKQALEKLPNTGNVTLREVSADDGNDVFATVEKIFAEYKIPFDNSVHLNYTGGTKSMSVHVHRAFCALRQKAVRSYLSATSLKLFIDETPQPEYPGARIKVTFDEMASLHGYVIDSRDSEKFPPTNKKIAHAVAQIHCSAEGFFAWRKWINTFGQANSPILPDVNDPLLGQFRIAVNDACNGNATAESFARIFNAVSLRSLSKWLIGGWLENLVFFSLQKSAKTLNYIEFGTGIHPKPTRQVTEKRIFDLDAAAIVGYQLFSFSCILSEEMADAIIGYEMDAKKALRNLRNAAKGHLFEALVRSQQLGGEEARTALVGIFSDPLALQKDVERDWSIRKNRIRVFGQADLLKLDDLIPAWIDETLKSQKGR